MTAEEIRGALDDAAKLRMPQRTPDETSTAFIDRLTDYLLVVAQTRGALEEARLHAHGALDLLEDRWDALEGWESVAGSRRATAQQRDDAKATLDPDLWQGIKDARRLVNRLTEQIKRLSGLSEDEVASRAYSLLTGS